MMQIESEFELFLAFARETIADVLLYVIFDFMGLKKRNFVVLFFSLPKRWNNTKHNSRDGALSWVNTDIGDFLSFFA